MSDGVRLANPTAALNPGNVWIKIWLWCLVGLIFAMVVVGGATRLTESGLSITEWRPVTGVIPPLGVEQWQSEFEKYKQIPQYHELFPDMDLARFQTIFLWEWSHRLLGRLLALALALPLVYFTLTRQLSRGLLGQMLAVFALGGLQGFVGWWMVQSGLSSRVEVSQYWLALHLLLASFTFSLLIWIASDQGVRQWQAKKASLGSVSVFIWLATFLQLGFGALMAGLRAGYTYNTWPLMDGKFIPPLEDLTRQRPLWSNLFENVTTVQLDHRLMAYIIFSLALTQAFLVYKAGGNALARGISFLALVLLQGVVGILTLLNLVALPLALTHQALALIVLGFAAFHLAKIVQAQPT